MRSHDENILLGLKYLKGTLESGGDPSKIVEWCHRVAEEGNSNAQWFLGVMYAVGAGVQQSDSTAISWLLKSAGRGNTGAQTDLGIMLALGKGNARDREGAMEWLMIAASKGNVKAARALERLQHPGLPPPVTKSRFQQMPKVPPFDKSQYTFDNPHQHAGVWKVPTCNLCDAPVDEKTLILDGRVICLKCIWTRVFC